MALFSIFRGILANRGMAHRGTRCFDTFLFRFESQLILRTTNMEVECCLRGHEKDSLMTLESCGIGLEYLMKTIGRYVCENSQKRFNTFTGFYKFNKVLDESKEHSHNTRPNILELRCVMTLKVGNDLKIN